MHHLCALATLATVLSAPLVHAVSSQAYTWKNVKIGGGGGFVPGIIFNPKEKGVAYARTDIGGAYKLNADDSWTPLLDFVNNDNWNYWGVASLATDPVQTNRLYLAVGEYTNSWDPNNGTLLISTNYGSSFTPSPLPFKLGGNMPGRGMGERLAIDPNSNGILYIGAPSGKGLWKSTNFGTTWTKVANFPNVGNYAENPADTTGYNSELIYVCFTLLDRNSVVWVTFDQSSGPAGSPTPRIFVGVASNGTSNVFVSNNAGSTWSAVPGQNTTFFPHKGLISPAEQSLYITYSDGVGPYDGTNGAVKKYNISTSVWTDITPASGSNLYFGFGAIAIDHLNPGTVMVAALNSWWPDGQMYRSVNGGATWTPLWDWGNYPTMNKYYSYSDSLAPWIGVNYVDGLAGDLQIGWMMESLAIDPFDSNHWLYGTGETIYGGHDLLKWDTVHNVTISSLADGIEETSVQSLISPPTGANLISGLGDVQGFVHTSLTTAPTLAQVWTQPKWSTVADLDWAGKAPLSLVRIGTGTSSTGKQVALSNDGGNTWFQDYGAADNVQGGKVAISADGSIILWRTNGNGVLVSQHTNAFTAVPTLPSSAAIASDKVNGSFFYGAAGNSFYFSNNGAVSFAATKGSLGASTAPFKIVVNTAVSGDAWVSTDTGLFHTTDFGATFTGISGVSAAWAIGLGAPKTTGGYPAVFAAATISGTTGYFRSDDSGVNWIRVDDAAHGFGSISANCLTADPRIYGRVYVGTNGRGIFYGDTAGAAPPPTSTAASTSTTAHSSTASSSASTTPISSVHSSTSAPSSTKAPPTSTVSSSSPTGTGAQIPAFGQCGGNNWTGSTTCVAGYQCVFSNPFYSQCVPA